MIYQCDVNCPYSETCIARIIDTTITGCNMKEYVDETISSKSDIKIERTFVSGVTI